jgi:ferrous iron transport protein B
LTSQTFITALETCHKLRDEEKDRRMTDIVTSFIPCSAKLPVIALFAGALMGGAWWVAPVAYFLGVAAVVVSGLILKKSKIVNVKF